MKRLLPRPPRRRANRPQEGTDEAPQTAEAPPTEVQPAVPAGAEPADPVAPRPTFRNRGRLRRRLRFLRRVRELGFRDLGGLVFDQHRFNRPNEELVRGKLGALQAVDGELRALEALLDDARPIHELHEPGISACVRCGTLHGSDANFCPNCGAPISGPRAVGEIARAPAAAAATAAATTEVPPAPEPPAAAQPTEVVQPANDRS